MAFFYQFCICVLVACSLFRSRTPVQSRSVLNVTPTRVRYVNTKRPTPAGFSIPRKRWEYSTWTSSICHTHDTRSGNRHHKSTPFFRRQFLVRVSCKSGTGFVWYQIPAPIRTLFYSRPERGVHMTEMIIYDFITGCKDSGGLGEFIVYVTFSHVYF